MRAIKRSLIGAIAIVAASLVVDVNSAVAQGTGPPVDSLRQPLRNSTEVELRLDREVFSYPGDGRRDPFRPVLGKDGFGPLFDELALRGIIYSPNPGLSIAIVADSAGKRHRLRRGDVIGNARVVAIDPYRVRFAVENFGLVREEAMDLAQRETVAEQRQQQGTRTLGELFEEQLLRALTGRDSARAQTPAQPQADSANRRTRPPLVPRRPGGGNQ